jgi:hypothetical protein
MRTLGVLSVLILLVVPTSAQLKRKNYQTGTIVSVQRQEPAGVSYRKATDASARSTAFIYDVSVQVADTVFVGRYETVIDYFPSNWVQGNSVQLSIEKHRMYLQGLSAEDFELSVVGHHPVPKGK